jgi:hypothetical protein
LLSSVATTVTFFNRHEVISSQTTLLTPHAYKAQLALSVVALPWQLTHHASIGSTAVCTSGTKRAYIRIAANTPDTAYAFVSDKAKGTITMHLAKLVDLDKVTDNPTLVSGCSVTFKLVAGYAFDQAPPPGARCPPSAVPRTVNGRTFCELCETGSFKNSTGVCSSCPAGQFQNLSGSTSCRACPPGASCFRGTTVPTPCSPGSFSAKPGSVTCTKCPANTFSGMGAKACTKCPRFTRSPAGSEECGVFW